jgi:hypothetical protein
VEEYNSLVVVNGTQINVLDLHMIEISRLDRKKGGILENP